MKSLILLFCLINSLVIASVIQASNSNEKAQFIWIDDAQLERNVFAYFRNDFKLETSPLKFKINLFADSRYHLFVNGTFINFGPSRFFPENPQYDTHDIAAYLKKGQNTIAVKVMSNGMETYQLLMNRGGFIAWGNEGNTSNINLKTPGNWKAKKSIGHDQNAPRFSFAQGAIEIYDSRKEAQDWNLPQAVLKNWIPPFVINETNVWGDLTPREIPHLSQKESLPRKLVSASELADDEDIYSFRVKVPGQLKHDYNSKPRLFAYTYLYSPVEQTVEAGLWWGEHYLNGKAISAKKNSTVAQRNNAQLVLNKGWNFYFVKYDAIWGVWDYHLAIPVESQVTLSPNRTFDSENIFMSAGPFKKDEKKTIANLDLPIETENSVPLISENWIGHKRNDTANNPAWLMAWKPFKRSLDIPSFKTTDFIVKKDQDSAYVFDMGFNSLGRIFIDVDAPAGTVFDLGWSENLKDDSRANVLNRTSVFTGARFIAKGGEQHFETFRPYGHRMLQLNIYDHNEQVKIRKIGRIESLYPLNQVGSFDSSDPAFNALWALGWRTIRICAEDVYTDPFRERGLYAGDLLPETLVGYVTSGDTKLIKKSLRETMGMYADVMDDYPNISPNRYGYGLLDDYPLIALVNLKWYYDITNDIDFVTNHFPKLQRMMDSLALRQQENGVFEPQNSFIEWTTIEKKEVSLTTMHALYYKAFSDISELSRVLKNTKKADYYSNIAKKIKTVLPEKFWDETSRSFFDGFKKGQKIDSHFIASSAWPSMFGVTTKSQEVDLKLFFENELKNIGNKNRNSKSSPYGGFYLLGALFKNENTKIAENYMRQYWFDMIEWNDTAWEDFFVDQHSSKSHGWSTAPTYYLSTQVLGVQLGFPDSTDLSKVTISPQSSSLTWAKGVVPHPTGNVIVDWKVKGDNLFLNYSVADGVEVIVNPKGRLADLTLWINGNVRR